MPVKSNPKTGTASEESKRMPLEAWDFDSCPKAELGVCRVFEYGKESKKIRQYVCKYRSYKQKGVNPLMLKAAIPAAAQVLLEFADFPEKHWLQIPELARVELCSQIGESIAFPPVRYSLTPSDGARFDRELNSWGIIRKEQEELLARWMGASDSPESLRNSLEDHGVSTEGLSAGELRLKAIEARRSKKREIERLHRRNIEDVLYQINWGKPDSELIDEYEQWLKLNRIHKPRPRGGGQAATDADLLRALAAKRLLVFFSSPPELWPKKYQKEKKEGAVESYVRDELTRSARPVRPLYSHFKGYYDAAKRADDHLGMIEGG